MALKAKLDQVGYDVLDDAGKANYKKAGDGYVVDVEGIEDVTALENTVKALRVEIKDFRTKAKEFEGIDPAKARQYETQAQEAERKLKEANGDYTAVTTQMKDAHAKELKTERDRFASLETTFSNKVRSEAIAVALAKHKGSILLVPHVERLTKVVQAENGDYSVQVLSADGKPRVDAKTGSLMTMDGLIEEMKADTLFGVGFEATQRGGGGAPTSKLPAGGGAPDNKGSRTSTDKIRDGLTKLGAGNATIG